MNPASEGSKYLSGKGVVGPVEASTMVFGKADKRRYEYEGKLIEILTVNTEGGRNEEKIFMRRSYPSRKGRKIVPRRSLSDSLERRRTLGVRRLSGGVVNKDTPMARDSGGNYILTGGGRSNQGNRRINLRRDPFLRTLRRNTRKDCKNIPKTLKKKKRGGG